jgi:wobble nucleotide-excising tRNase
MPNYVIIDAKSIQKRIEELEVEQEKNHLVNVEKFNCLISEIKAYRNILSQSTPLIPEIEKAFDAGSGYLDITLPVECKKEYISNLKIK